MSEIRRLCWKRAKGFAQKHKPDLLFKAADGSRRIGEFRIAEFRGSPSGLVLLVLRVFHRCGSHPAGVQINGHEQQASIAKDIRRLILF